MNNRTANLFASIVFVVLFSILFWYWAMPSATDRGPVEPGLSSDIVNYFYPMLDLVRNTVRHCRIPLWNPHEGCGRPFAATVEVGVFYPGKILLVLLPTHVFLRVDAIIHLTAGGVFMVLFLRRFGCSLFGQLVGAALFTFAISSTGMYNPSIMETIVWLPAAAFAVDRLSSRGKLLDAVLLALVLSLHCLAGSVQFFVYTTYFVMAYGVFRTLELHASTQLPRRVMLRCLLMLVAAIGFTGGITAVQVLPSYEMVEHSVRSEGASEEELEYNARLFPGGTSPGTFVRNIFRTEAKWTAFGAGGTGHLTVVGFLLACLAPLAGRRRAVMIFLAVAAIVTIVTAFGTAVPHNVLLQIYQKLPLMNLFRVPMRLCYLGLFCSIVLASLGAGGLRDWLDRGAWTPGTAATLVVQVGLIALFLVLSGVPGRIIAGLYGATLAAVLVGRTREHGNRLRGPIALAVSLGLIIVNIFCSTPRDGILRQMTPGFYSDEITILSAAKRIELYQRVAQLGVVRPKVAQLAGAYSPGDYEPVPLRRYADLFSAHRVPTFLGLSIFTPESSMRLLDLMSASILIARPPIQPHTMPGELEPIAIIDGASIYRNRGALPRAYVAYNWQYVEPTAAALATASEEFDPRQTVLLEEVSDRRPSAGRSIGITPGTISVYADDRVEFLVEARMPGVAVLTDTWYPGWYAFVDGMPARIERVNGMFRGIFVSRGTHTVRLEYKPLSVLLGMTLSVATLSCLVLVALFRLYSARARANI